MRVTPALFTLAGLHLTTLIGLSLSLAESILPPDVHVERSPAPNPSAVDSPLRISPPRNPRCMPGAILVVGGPITTSTRWDCVDATYLITRDVVVAQGAELILAEGIEVLASPGTTLRVGEGSPGSLTIAGSEKDPVSLRAFTGSTWGGIVVGEEAGLVNLTGMDLLDVAPHTEGGGPSAAIVVLGGDFSMAISTVEHVAGTGVFVGAAARSIWFEGDFFSDIRGPALHLPVDRVDNLDLSVDFDGTGPIELWGEVIPTSTTWPNFGVPYSLSSPLDVGGPEDPHLTLEPGVQLQIAPEAQLSVGENGPGHLHAVGTPSQPVVFLPGDVDLGWPGIGFGPDAGDSQLENVEIYGAGRLPGNSAARPALQVVGTTEVGLREVLIEDVLAEGLSLEEDGALATCEGVTLRHTGPAAVRADANRVGSLDVRILMDEGSHIHVEGGVISTSQRWSQVVPYHIAGGILVQGEDEPVLTLDGGASLFFEKDASLVVGRDLPGDLIIEGEDDAVYLAAWGSPEDGAAWGGVVLDTFTTSRSRLSEVSLNGCGAPQEMASRPVDACVGVVDSAPRLEAVHIQSSVKDGVQIYGAQASPQLDCLTFGEIRGESIRWLDGASSSTCPLSCS